jgi:hypothetical protein
MKELSESVLSVLYYVFIVAIASLAYLAFKILEAIYESASRAYDALASLKERVKRSTKQPNNKSRSLAQ